jgi:hypothetical protein
MHRVHVLILDLGECVSGAPGSTGADRIGILVVQAINGFQKGNAVALEVGVSGAAVVRCRCENKRRQC